MLQELTPNRRAETSMTHSDAGGLSTVIRFAASEEPKSIAVQLCAQFEGPIHLIIADVVLRSISGPDVVKYALTMRPDTKALFISGHPREVLVEQGLSEEMPFLAKPFAFKELEGRIQELLRSSTPASGRLARQEPAGSEPSKSLFARLHADRSGGRTAGTDK